MVQVFDRMSSCPARRQVLSAVAEGTAVDLEIEGHCSVVEVELRSYRSRTAGQVPYHSTGHTGGIVVAEVVVAYPCLNSVDSCWEASPASFGVCLKSSFVTSQREELLQIYREKQHLACQSSEVEGRHGLWIEAARSISLVRYSLPCSVKRWPL